MQAVKYALIRVLLPGSAVALSLVVIAAVFLDAEQCPAGYTQAQIDASGCIVGANIGQGLVWLAALAVEAVTLIATVIVTLVVVLRHKHS